MVEARHSTSTSANLPARQVSFDMAATSVCYVQSVKDMSRDDVNATWYRKDDLTVIRDQNNLTAKLMKIGRENPEQFGYCYRGLEYRQNAKSYRRNAVMMTSIGSVLTEQERLRSEKADANQDGRDQMALLAAAYEGYSKSCLERARLIGNLDQQKARIIHEEEPEDSGQADQSFLTVKGTRRNSICSSTIMMSDSEDFSCTFVDVLNDGDISDLSDNEEAYQSPSQARRPKIVFQHIKGYMRRRNGKKETF